VRGKKADKHLREAEQFVTLAHVDKGLERRVSSLHVLLRVIRSTSTGTCTGKATML